MGVQKITFKLVLTWGRGLGNAAPGAVLIPMLIWCRVIAQSPLFT